MDQLFGWLAVPPNKKDQQEQNGTTVDDPNIDDQNNKDHRNDDEEEDKTPEAEVIFPTHPGFTVPVEIKPTPHLGPDQYGVFAAADIPKHTADFWIWTDRVVAIPSNELATYIQTQYPDPHNRDRVAVQQFLRRGFVLPSPYDDVFYSNPTDAGTYMNHSSDAPNCARPYGTTRLIHKGEELTMDYSGNGNPLWYQDICHMYGILTAVEVAQHEQARGGLIEPAVYSGPVTHSLLEQLIPF